jgi:AraC-like DNA-binding protein
MLRPSKQPESFCFSTADMPVRERRKAVCELRERGILPIEPLRNADLSVVITKHFLPGAGILSGALCGLRHGGSPRAADAGDELFLGINLAGRSIVQQCGRELTFGDGEAALLSLEAGAFSILRPTPAQFVGLRVPRQAITPMVPGLDGRTMRIIPAATPAMQLLTNYVRAIVDNRALGPDEMPRLVATHLHDLIALSVDAGRDSAVAAIPSVRVARLLAIKSDILDSLDDASMTVSVIATRHRVTPRYVHKLFEADGTTFTQFVLRQRLDRVYRMLRDPLLLPRSITSIAYDAGFGDLSYFNRTFRRHYCATPSDIRSGAAG